MRAPQSFSRRGMTAIAMAAMLCGCASYDDPYYVHSVWRPAQGASGHADVFYLTDRHADPNFPGGFDYRQGTRPSCGIVHANVPAARVPTGPAVFAAETGRAPLACGTGQTGFAAAIADDARRRNCGSVLVFVHGFDTGFETAVLRGAQLAQDTQWGCAVAAFSWSSSGQRANYALDRGRSRDAEPLFADFLRALSAAGLRIDIIAHSMGTTLALDTLAEQESARVDQLILAAPDIGMADGNTDFPALARAATAHFHRLTIYASDDDAVLAVSRRLNKGVARLGNDPAAAFRDTMPNIDVIDASDVPGDFMGHNYYGLSREIVADMALVLADVPAQARLAPRPGAAPTLMRDGSAAPYRLNVAWDRAPDFLTRFLRWLVAAFAG